MITWTSYSYNPREYLNWYKPGRYPKKDVPVIPPLPPGQPNPDPNPVVAICGECGREIRHIEMYWCPNPRCPIQLKIWC